MTDILIQFDQTVSTIGDTMVIVGIGLIIAALGIVIYIILKGRGE